MDPQNLTFEQKVDLFRKIADCDQARAEYAESRAEVLLPLIEDHSTIRAIFQTEKLAPGADARYDVPFDDIDCCILMPQIGGIPFVQMEGAEIHVDTFGVTGGVEWQEDIARDGRFQVGERATRMLLNKFLQQEEYAGWALIKTHAGSLPSEQKVQALKDDGSDANPGEGTMNMMTFNEIITVADELGQGGRTITDMYVSVRRFNDLRNQLANVAMPEHIRDALWNNGKGANTPVGIRVHKVYNQDLVPDNKAYAFTRKDGYKYGVMPIRTPLVTRNNPIAVLEHKIGVFGRERLGMAVLDDKGLVEVTF